MQILDGYTLSAKFSEIYVEYRPMLHRERVAFLHRLRQVRNPPLSVLDAVKRHVVWHDGPLPEITDGFVSAIIGKGCLAQERADAQNLYNSARLIRSHPKLAEVSCADCQKWEFFPLTGNFNLRNGKRVERDESDLLLCQTATGCPKVSPEEEAMNSPSPVNRMAIRFHEECAAIKAWPDDPIVRRNARVIEKAWGG